VTYKARIFLGCTLLVIVLDQLSKYWVMAGMDLHQSIPVIEGLFNLTYVRNTGVAFGLFAGYPSVWRTTALVLVSGAAMIIILLFLRKVSGGERLWALGLGLVFGGAWGNVLDRIRFGYVVDFLDFHIGRWHWPAFNAADSAVTVGTFLLLIKILTEGRGRRHVP